MKLSKAINIITILLIASLPLSEGVKNIALLLLLISFISALITRGYSKRKNGWIIIISFFLISGIISSIMNYEKSEIDGIYDSIKLFLPFFSILFISGNFLKYYSIYYAAIISTIIACIISIYLDHDFFTRYHDIRLLSISPVNSVAIYISLVYGITLAIFLTQKNKTFKEKLFLSFALGFLGFFLLCTATRGSILSTVIISCLILCLQYGLKRFLIIIFPTLIIILSLGITLNMNFINKFNRTLEHGVQLTKTAIGHRDTTFIMAKIIAENNPFWGIGPSNAKYYFTKDACIVISEQSGHDYNHNDFINCYHAHNFYMNILCERGLIGLLAILFFFLALSYKLIKTRWIFTGAYNIPFQSKMLWYSCLYATCTTLLNGLFNTTLRNEIGLLTLIIIGVWLIDSESYVTHQSAK